MTEPTPDSSLRALTEADFERVIALARRIWLSHFIKIVSREQIEYMMNARLTTLNLRRYLHADDRWFDVLMLDDEPVGYCSYALTATAGEIKLEQLYLSPELHGRGLGGLMLRHVQSRAQALGCRTMVLQVNKQNTGPVAVYRAAGFTVREEAVFDIGHGFVMDDYVMEKRLG
jgi:diamine N-acetyltransferase